MGYLDYSYAPKTTYVNLGSGGSGGDGDLEEIILTANFEVPTPPLWASAKSKLLVNSNTSQVTITNEGSELFAKPGAVGSVSFSIPAGGFAKIIKNDSEDGWLILSQPKRNVYSTTGTTIEIPTSELLALDTTISNVGDSNLTITTEGSETLGGSSILVLQPNWTAKLVSNSGNYFVTTYENQPPNEAPVASFTVSNSGMVYTYTSTATDSDGTIATVVWTMPDLSIQTGTVATFDHEPEGGAGTYTIVQDVTDNLGAPHSASLTYDVVDSIPEPPTSVTDISAFRFWEAPFVGGDRIEVVPNHYALEDITSSGNARPLKVSAGIGSVLLDGINHMLQALSLTEYKKIHDGTSDWQMSFTYLALEDYDNNSATLVGTGSASSGFRIFAAENTRIYAYSTTNDDNSSINTANDDLWTSITLCFDASHNDLYRFKNGVAIGVDGNWAFTPADGPQHIALAFGIHPATNGKYPAQWRDWRLAFELGDVVNDGPTYNTWANNNSVKV